MPIPAFKVVKEGGCLTDSPDDAYTKLRSFEVLSVLKDSKDDIPAH